MTILSILALLLAYFLSLSFINSTINKMAQHKGTNIYRIRYVSKTITIGLTLFFIILFFLLLGVEYSQVSLFLSSFFAVAGIALFAQWSILSNVTASLIIFFAFPYRVGDNIRIADKDGDLSGVIEEITMFHVILSHENTIITYPNSLILQKAVIKLADKPSA